MIGGVDLHPLLEQAHRVAVDRTEQYGDWRTTAATINPDDLAEYPRMMIRVKLARDPQLEQLDTLVDVVNYAGMIHELRTPASPPAIPDHVVALFDAIHKVITRIRTTSGEPSRIWIRNTVPAGEPVDWIEPVDAGIELGRHVRGVAINPDDWSAILAANLGEPHDGYLFDRQPDDPPTLWGIPVEVPDA